MYLKALICSPESGHRPDGRCWKIFVAGQHARNDIRYLTRSVGFNLSVRR